MGIVDEMNNKVIKYDDGGRNELEELNPDSLERINQLRKERDEYSAKAIACQREIDELYNNIGGFEDFIGKVIDLKVDEEEEDGTYETLYVTHVERLSKGARLEGSRIIFDDTDKREKPFVYYDSHSYQTYYYRDVPTIKVIPMEEYEELVKKVKDLIK